MSIAINQALHHAESIEKGLRRLEALLGERRAAADRTSGGATWASR